MITSPSAQTSNCDPMRCSNDVVAVSFKRNAVIFSCVGVSLDEVAEDVNWVCAGL